MTGAVGRQGHVQSERRRTDETAEDKMDGQDRQRTCA